MSWAFSFSRCDCQNTVTGFWSVENVLQCQKVSDFLIALAYFSIPLELFYFVSCSTIFPFRWILLQFGAFIVLCGLTHFVAVWTYAPHSFHVLLALTVLKFLTALVSFATSITLVTLIPQMLQVMVREGLLRKKTRELRREVGMMKRQEETRSHVRMLTQEIRRSLDRHTILYTTLVELSKVLFLENCAVWMPDEERTVLNLSHVLERRDSDELGSIPLNDPDVVEIVGREGVRVLRQNSRLCRGFGGEFESGAAAAVRMPMLRVSNFKAGSPEFVDACYGVLVVVLPKEGNRVWRSYELELVEVVADQVAVALSHVAVLEESLFMKEKLLEQNMALECARQKVLLVSEARSTFQKVMSQEITMPARSVAALLSVLQKENLRPEQQLVVDAMVKVNLLLSTLINDATGISNLEGRLELDLRSFSLHSMLKEVVGVSKLLYACRDLSFDFEVSKEVPDFVIGDEKRILQLVLYMVVNFLNSGGDCGNVILHVCTYNGSEGDSDPNYFAWRQAISEEFTRLRFEVSRTDSTEGSSSLLTHKDKKCGGETDTPELSFAICKKFAQLMHGNISISPTSKDLHRSMNLTIKLQLKKLEGGLLKSGLMDHETSRCVLKGMNILLADTDDFNRSIMRKLLKNLGGHLSVVSSWYQCLDTLRLNGNKFQLLLIDLNMLKENICEMSARVRKLRSGGWLLIVALTSKANSDTRDRCLRNGIHGMICKPVILQEMEDELQRIVQQGGPHTGSFTSSIAELKQSY
ncbi:ethylene receptor 2-like [Tasmannia lanceolata]|uniref:ethylene receptor 2-like n=1 Tax=Tasmannia lanceolata TaxID=3420 RepID=UPI0040629A85